MPRTKPVSINAQEMYLVPEILNKTELICCAAPDSAINLPDIAPKSSTSRIDPTVSPMPFCMAVGIFSIGMPNNNPPKIETMIKAMKG